MASFLQFLEHLSDPQDAARKTIVRSGGPIQHLLNPELLALHDLLDRIGVPGDQDEDEIRPEGPELGSCPAVYIDGSVGDRSSRLEFSTSFFVDWP
jgi:hypothetical protein